MHDYPTLDSPPPLQPMTARELLLSGGELPRLAGGGGPWQLPISGSPIGPASLEGPPVTAKPGEPITFKELNLLTQPVAQPTIMEEWILNSIYCPIGFLFIAGKKIAAATTFAVQLTIKVGGDLRWASTPTVPQVITILAGEEVAIFNTIIGEQFISPIHYRRGRTLTLGATVFTTIEAIATAIIFNPGSHFGGANGTLVVVEQGMITYDSEALSGHRML